MADAGFLVRAFLPPPALPPREDVETSYPRWRYRVLATTTLGYAAFYLCRKNLPLAMPVLAREFGYSNTDLGTLGTILYLTYGAGKLCNGVFGDHLNPRVFMSVGLLLSAVTNLAFGASTSLAALGLFWGLNGWFQSMGFPPCARILAHWFSVKERGFYWGLWNTSHQIGAAAIEIGGAWLLTHYGWRSIFVIPAFGLCRGRGRNCLGPARHAGIGRASTGVRVAWGSGAASRRQRNH